MTGFFSKKGRAIILTGTIIICSYLAVLAISKFQLEYSLKSEYDENKIELLQTYPSERHGFAMWDFHVRTKEIWVNGYSPMYNTELHIETERKVDFN
ncbi:hypothetical protein F9U64_06460 [Gracilibacillus oryzae]|uniref:Uncharacterized protein n=1 Tax=Gracilibacillus oryzae TaxID=1672701 RepID=A0A7C8KRB1_9BACI|nr:hypothetical protein [Gracilibacillus oryzae]KAB8138084.1 hypothetical protein F9U64_06460 [Gracilibacillus oryzae]